MKTLSSWQSTGQFLSLAGRKIFYVAEGKGPEVILLLHGFPTSSWDWYKIWPQLRKSYQLITLDFLGFGYSDKPRDHTYSFKEQADIVEQLLQKLGITACHVLAHDYGDTVAQELIARQIERKLSFALSSVCLLNGGIFPEAHSRRLIQKLLLGPLGFAVSALATKATLRRNFHNIFGPQTPPTETEIDEFWTLITHNGGRRVMHKLITYLKEREQFQNRWIEALQRCPVPLRLMNGNFDPISGSQMVKRFEELVEIPDTVSFREIGHYPQVEAPELVLKHYLDFLRTV